MEAGNPRAAAWVAAKVQAQLDELATRPEGDRNHFLNSVAYSFGRLAPKWLDPTEVALAYAAARGWSDAAAVDTTAAGVTIRSAAGTHVLALAQPGKTGLAGIWVVTADD